MQRLNWGLIGLGRMGESFAEDFPADQTLAGVAAHDAARATAFAARFHTRAYPDYAALFADPAIDVVYIATTHNFHYANIKAALNAGKHVLAEKSITLNSAQLAELQTLAAARHLILMEAQTIYHMPLYPAIDAAVAGLGRLRTVQVSLGINPDLPPEDRLFNPALAGGALLDIGVYALSFARRLIGGALMPVASTMTRMATGADDASLSLLTGPAGEQISVALSLQAEMPDRGLAVYEHGYVEVTGMGRADVATLTQPSGTTTITAGDRDLALVYEAHDMVTAIATGQAPSTAATTDVMAAMTAIRRQWDYWYPGEAH